MALETASYVADLVVSNPDGGDQRSTADDHLRLIKAVLKRTWPKVDAAISLSAVQYSYLNDLSASVQVQLNTLRDGPATANFAVNARFASSASTAALIGTIPASDIARLGEANTFTNLGHEIANILPRLRLRETEGAADNQLWAVSVNNEQFVLSALNDAITQNAAFMTVARTGQTIDSITLAATAIALVGTVTGTISNAQRAESASYAALAGNASTASSALFAASAGSSALLSGLPPLDTMNPNTIAQRNSSGDLYARYFNMTGSPQNDQPDYIVVSYGDGFLQLSTLANAQQYLACQNISGRTGTTKTLSSSAPSGGGNGDIWYQTA
jgi:hypothetical protein